MIVSSLLLAGNPSARLIERVLTFHIAVTTKEIFSELAEVPERPKFDRYLSRQERMEFLLRYTSRCRVVESNQVVIDCRDPDDNKFFALALESGADFLISGDIHLLELNPWRGIPILNPRDFLARYPSADLS